MSGVLFVVVVVVRLTIAFVVVVVVVRFTVVFGITFPFHLTLFFLFCCCFCLLNVMY